jgi:hemolysin III
MSQKQERSLPAYSHGEEIMNTVTHIAGGGVCLLGAIGCIVLAVRSGSTVRIWTTTLYCFTLTLVYTMSSIYHGLPVGKAKRVMQVMDHCSIYLLITGTYSPIVLCAIAPIYPAIGWGLFAAQWLLTALAVTLTAVDMHRYKVFSKVCYIAMGWGIIFFLPQALEVLGGTGFLFLLAGGIAYTIGAVLFGLGQRIKWMHSIFHLFVVMGTLLQMVTVAFYL